MGKLAFTRGEVSTIILALHYAADWEFSLADAHGWETDIAKRCLKDRMRYLKLKKKILDIRKKPHKAQTPKESE